MNNIFAVPQLRFIVPPALRTVCTPSSFANQTAEMKQNKNICSACRLDWFYNKCNKQS